MSFIDASYFVGDLNIPNSDNAAVLERINWYIGKYEPLFLQKALGYPLYRALAQGMNVVPPATPDIRYLNIIYGCQYTDLNGLSQTWEGLITTDIPEYNLAGGYVYKKPVYLTAGITPGLIPGQSTAVFDGTGGKDNWIGWTPIVTRVGVMQPGVDYSWDPATGTFTLLHVGDVFGPAEYFFVQFELRTDGPETISGFVINQSIIADFVYYWFSRNNSTQSTGIGEVRTDAENSTNVSPRQKMISSWNEMRRGVKDLICFLEANQTIYTEWIAPADRDALRYFGFMNPIF